MKENIKTKTCKIYLTEKEYEEIRVKAEQQNKSISQYLLDCSQDRLDVEIIINDLTEFTAQIYELEKKINSIKNIAIQAGDVNEKELAKIEELMISINNLCKEIIENGYEDRKQVEKKIKKYCKDKFNL